LKFQNALALFFKAVEEKKVRIVTTHGKLCGKWSRIENCFELALKKPTQQHTDDNSSVSGSSSYEDDSRLIKYRI
jgi:hypothetical protein